MSDQMIKQTPIPPPPKEEERATGQNAPEDNGTPEPEKTRNESEKNPLEVLDPSKDQRIWIIGKPPEMGGNEQQWSRYIQRPLGYMGKLRFFALFADALSKAMKETNSGLDDILSDFSPAGFRSGSLTPDDLRDAGSFMNIAVKLIAVVPDFLLDCYMIWLDVPNAERAWAKQVMEQPWRPDEGKWGLDDDRGLEIIQVFIDQNYEEIRAFFVERLSKLVESLREKEAVPSSESGQ